MRAELSGAAEPQHQVAPGFSKRFFIGAIALK